MKIFRLIAYVILVSSFCINAELIVRVSNEDFQRLSNGKTVIHHAGKKHIYLTHSDGFYYVAITPGAIKLSNSPLVDTPNMPIGDASNILMSFPG